jgi:hypothetical protein
VAERVVVSDDDADDDLEGRGGTGATGPPLGPCVLLVTRASLLVVHVARSSGACTLVAAVPARSVVAVQCTRPPGGGPLPLLLAVVTITHVRATSSSGCGRGSSSGGGGIGSAAFSGGATPHRGCVRATLRDSEASALLALAAALPQCVARGVAPP